MWHWQAEVCQVQTAFRLGSGIHEKVHLVLANPATGGAVNQKLSKCATGRLRLPVPHEQFGTWREWGLTSDALGLLDRFADTIERLGQIERLAQIGQPFLDRRSIGIAVG